MVYHLSHDHADKAVRKPALSAPQAKLNPLRTPFAAAKATAAQSKATATRVAGWLRLFPVSVPYFTIK
jgi:hypothetical protein